MPMDLEKRNEPRVAFTLTRSGVDAEDAVPVWQFASASEEPRLRGWVLNMSKGGMQVLAPAGVHRRLRATVYDVTVDTGGDPAECFEARVRRVWSRDVEHLGQLNGFEFEEPQPLAAAFLARHPVPHGQALKWLVCHLVAR